MNEIDQKQNQSIKLLRTIVIILVILIIGVVGYLVYDKLYGIDNTKKTYDDTSNVVIEKTPTTTVVEGTYVTDVTEVVNNVMPSIVAITSKTVSNSILGTSYSTGAGSGIIIDKTKDKLLILTNQHVVDDSDKLTVQFINNKSVEASVLGESSSYDVALVSVKLSDLDKDTLNSIKIATLGDSTKLSVGQGIIAIGNALGYGQSVTTGVISALDREVTTEDYTSNMIQIDAAINGGNSGGALLNSSGEVIGINSLKYSSKSTTTSNIEGMGFAIPISDIKDLINKLKEGKILSKTERGYLGISGVMITDAYSEYYEIPKGIYVRQSVNNKILKGDIITSIDGKEIKSMTTLNSVLEEKKANEKVKITIKRKTLNNYKEEELEIYLLSYREAN